MMDLWDKTGKDGDTKGFTIGCTLKLGFEPGPCTLQRICPEVVTISDGLHKGPDTYPCWFLFILQ